MSNEVTVTGFRTVTTDEGKTFTNLILSGGLEMVKSKSTGRFYATTRKCSIGSTLTEEHASLMIGTKLKGSIVRIEVDPYDFTTESGEIIQLSHSWEYQDEDFKVSSAAEVIEPLIEE